MNRNSKVLSETQILQLYKQMKLGDENARNQLIEANTGLVGHIIKKYHNQSIDIDDLFSTGCIGLINAIDTYDIDKGIKLSTYACICIENAIITLIRGSKKFFNQIYLDSYIRLDSEEKVITRLDHLILIDPNEIFENYELKERRQRLLSIIKELEPRYQYVIMHRYGLIDGRLYTQQEISDMIGISRSYISRVEKKALCKLRSIILNERL